jgi:predicted 3-demethylubiquinone-9 3-methyltransferase (glyoxalase superfamily)
MAEEAAMTDVTPFLWFDDSAEAAIDFYTGLIPGSELVSIGRYPDEVPGMGGKVMHAHFRLAGRDYYAMDAGPQFPFTEAISLYVSCADQQEVDRYWTALTADGGQEQPCAWLKDRWGLSWQIVPDRLVELIRDPDPERSHRAVQAMFTMTKIDIAAIEAAADAS